DLSFTSLRPVLAPLARIAAPGADHVVLVKPQFEARREDVGDGGVVRDPQVWRRAVGGVATAGRAEGLHARAGVASPVRGPAGNVEFLLHLPSRDAPGTLDLDPAIDAGRELAR